jgi:hypothetical protein
MTTEATLRIRYQVAIPLCHVAKIATIIQKHHECEIFNSLIHCVYRLFSYFCSKSYNVMIAHFIYDYCDVILVVITIVIVYFGYATYEYFKD